MIAQKDIDEIRQRDFLQNINYFHEFDEVETKLILGTPPTEPVFLTIILPVYDHPQEFIRRAINSALNQPCPYDYRLLVIDDYAKQTTPTETERYLRERKDDRVLYYKNQKNLGVFGNWNRAIMLANSTWVSFLHSDDFLQDNYLENMGRIVSEHPEIDQLACNYRMLNFLKDDIIPNKEYKGHGGTKTVRKIYASEYWHYMPTSVKGSFYKRDKLMELGGFRSQGVALGLDDYTLMLRFAYYYNTYLLDDVLYLNSWAHNDSLNTKHWYPELIANYYMCLYFAKREIPVLRYLYKTRARHMLIERAIAFDNGTSWVGVPVPIDFDELQAICGLKSLHVNKLWESMVRFAVRCLNYLKRKPTKSFSVTLTEHSETCTIE